MVIPWGVGKIFLETAGILTIDAQRRSCLTYTYLDGYTSINSQRVIDPK
jgi:hypothetical protein